MLGALNRAGRCLHYANSVPLLAETFSRVLTGITSKKLYDRRPELLRHAAVGAQGCRVSTMPEALVLENDEAAVEAMQAKIELQYHPDA